MKGQRVGYVRVSSFDQNPERQLEPMRGPNTASAMKHGANISRNYAPISVYHRLACLTSAFWYVV